MSKMEEFPDLPDRLAEDEEETAGWALARTVRLGQHGQHCPVWTQRTTVDLCDCWILRRANRDAATALAAANRWEEGK